VDHELAFLATLLDRLDRREPPSLRSVLDWLGARRAEVPCERLAVVHGDFHRNNILLRADGAAFVIDWSNVRLGDYRSDLAWIRLLTRADTQPDTAAAELHCYERLAGKAVSRIDYFEIMAGARLILSVLAALQSGADREGMRPGAEALMRRNLEFIMSVAALLQRRTGLRMPDLEQALSALLA
jgi:aminoglycoside phosphotransferase (APT) family kinase protein